MRQQSHGFDQGLGDLQAVEGVLVVLGQGFDGGGVFCLDGQELVTRSAKMADGIVARYRHVAPSQAVLDGDFPDAGDADPDRGARRKDQLTRFSPQ